MMVIWITMGIGVYLILGMAVTMVIDYEIEDILIAIWPVIAIIAIYYALIDFIKDIRG